MIVVDTSIWVNHFRKAVPQLQEVLAEGQVLVHPFVIGELACGNLGQRRTVLGLLQNLPEAPLARQEEVLELIERRHLWGKGIGWVDAHLLASSLISGSRLWTADRRLRALAEQRVSPQGDRL